MDRFNEKELWPAFQRVNNLLKGKADGDAVAIELGRKVDKVEGKGLSSNDYTNAEKMKLSGIEVGAQVNVLEVVKRNGTALVPDANRAVDIAVPTAVSDLTNDSGFQTAAQVQSAVNAAVDPILSGAVTYGPSALVSFDGGGGGLPVKSCKVAVEEGVSSAAVYRAGKNLADQSQLTSAASLVWDGDTATWTVSNASNSNARVTVNLFAGVTYTLSCYLKVITRASGYNPRVVFRNMSWSVVASSQIGSSVTEGYVSVSYTPSADTQMMLGVMGTGSTAGSCQLEISQFQLEAGSSRTTYEAYQLGTWTYDPDTETLTPPVMTSLPGTNTVWSDSGNVTVEYGAFLPTIQQEIEGQANSMDDRVDALEAVITAAGPILIQNAEDITAAEGDDAIFSVRAAGSNLTYKWELYYSSSWTYPNFPGRDTPNMTVTATSSRNGYRFRCTITGGGWTVYSKIVTLHVT